MMWKLTRCLSWLVLLLVMLQVALFCHSDDRWWSLGAEEMAFLPEVDGLLLLPSNNKEEEMNWDIGTRDIWMGSRPEAKRLAPPTHAMAEGIQINDELFVSVGGYTDAYRNVSARLLFFSTSSQTWNDKDVIMLPPFVAETHQGLSYDRLTQWLYIVSGQKGPACQGATRVVARFHVTSHQFEMLPPLPQARYAPGTEIVHEPGSSIAFLHVFGGASEHRNDTATDHWRLRIDGSDTSFSVWEEQEPVPDGGTHGTSFLSDDGYVYYTGFCNLDPGMSPSDRMSECHRHAADDSGQLLHHVSDAGLLYRFPVTATALTSTRNKSNQQDPSPQWERRTDMPIPVCHGGSVAMFDKLVVVGGGFLSRQTRTGSAPDSVSAVQIYDSQTDSWTVVPFQARNKRSKFFLLSSWWDPFRQKIWSAHWDNVVMSLDLGRDRRTSTIGMSTNNPTKSLFEKEKQLASALSFQRSFFNATRTVATQAFNECLESTNNSVIPIVTRFEKDYEAARGTWNIRNRHLQFPDVVAFPRSVEQVQTLVKCSRRTGHHVCARNGKHSYDGNTCSRGIVVDVSDLNSVEINRQGGQEVHLGAGLTLGQVAVALEAHNLVLPAGTCATVGITGLTLNGGIGPLSRLYGLTSDFLEEIELVSSDGRIIRTSSDERYTDYLWLARGGGGGGLHFPGIITKLVFRNLPQAKVETYWTRTRIVFKANVGSAVSLLTDWQALHLDVSWLADPLCNRTTVMPWLFMNHDHRHNQFRPSLYLDVTMYGSQNHHVDFMERVVPRLKALGGGGVVRSSERLDALAFNRKLSGVRNNVELASGKHGHDLGKSWKGQSVIVRKRASQDAFVVLARTIFEDDGPACRRYAELKPLGGNIADHRAQNETAFWHRDALWLVLINHFCEEWREEGVSHRNSSTVGSVAHADRRQKLFLNRLGEARSGMYAGYADQSKCLMCDMKAYYGEHANRIRDLKRRYDPHNLFQKNLENKK